MGGRAVRADGGDDRDRPAPAALARRRTATVSAVAGACSPSPGAVSPYLAAHELGRALTPFPEPRSAGSSVESGPYRFVRHPIYAGGLLVLRRVRALRRTALRSSAPRCSALLWAHKARVEEQRLLRGRATARTRPMRGACPGVSCRGCGERGPPGPPAVERVAAFLRLRRAPRHGSRSSRQTLRRAECRGRGDRLPARPDRQVARPALRRRSGRCARPRRPARRHRQGRAGHRCDAGHESPVQRRWCRSRVSSRGRSPRSRSGERRSASSSTSRCSRIALVWVGAGLVTPPASRCTPAELVRLTRGEPLDVSQDQA